MKDVERALKRAGSRSAVAPERTTRRLIESAADHGLMDVAYATLDSPVGEVMVASTRRGLVRISFGASLYRDHFVEDLSWRISPRILEAPAYFDGVRRELDEYFEGKRTGFCLPLDWSLTGGFGRRVLRRTARIPYGETSTYREVATAAGNARAVRAAGTALGANPIPIVVPCHRVLHSGGGLGGYGGGLDKKKILLHIEGVL